MNTDNSSGGFNGGNEDYFGLNSAIPPEPSAPRPQRKKFEIHIDDEPFEIGDITVPEQPPQSKGEIYFSNRRAQKPSQPAPTQSAPVEVPIAAKKVPSMPRSAKKKPHVAAERFFSSENKFLLTFLGIVAIITVFLSAIAISCVNDVLALHRSDELITVNIPPNASTNEIIDILDENDLIHQKLFCKAFCSLMKVLKGSKTPVYLSGIYYVKPNMGIEGLLNEFKEAQKTEKTVSLVFPEGWSIYQIVNKLAEYNVCSKEHLLKAIKLADYDYDFIKAVPDNNSRTFKLEGYFFPDTYEFYENSDPNSVIRKFLSNFDDKWTPEFEKQRLALNLTKDEVLTIASIIQREAADTEQMKQISSVIHNRLNHSVSWPTLGCDSTLAYINNYVAINVPQGESNAYRIAYDTSMNRGLPPGPICNPGKAAIEAALFPDSTNYYYFCHDKYGKIYMASTQSEFDRNLLTVLRVNNS